MILGLGVDKLLNEPSALGQRARKRYDQLFTGELMGHRYAEVYRGLIGDVAEETAVQAATGGA